MFTARYSDIILTHNYIPVGLSCFVLDYKVEILSRSLYRIYRP